MFGYEIPENPSFNISTNIVDSIFESISKNVDISQKGIIGIMFVSPEKIQELNKEYREKDTVTDVLSFHYHDDFGDLGDDDVAGELIFCEEKIISQGKEYKLGTEKEFYKLLIHSVLHIIGYDHEEDKEYTEMKEVEDFIWKEVFETKFI